VSDDNGECGREWGGGSVLVSIPVEGVIGREEARYEFGVGEGRTLTIDNYGRNQSRPASPAVTRRRGGDGRPGGHVANSKSAVYQISIIIL